MSKKDIIFYICFTMLLFLVFWAGVQFKSFQIRRSGFESIPRFESSLSESRIKLEELDKILNRKEQNEQRAIELATDIIIDLSEIRDEFNRESNNIIERTEESNQRHEDKLSEFTEREKELGSAVEDFIRKFQ